MIILLLSIMPFNHVFCSRFRLLSDFAKCNNDMKTMLCKSKLIKLSNHMIIKCDVKNTNDNHSSPIDAVIWKEIPMNSTTCL